MLTVVDADGMTPNGALIDEIVREGARRLLAAALEAEVNAYLAQLADQRDESARRLVVRNGYRAERTVATAAGPIEVKAPRVNGKRIDPDTGERSRSASAIPKVRLEEAKACVLVLLGVRADGRKELIALDAGYRESAESWASLLRDAARRGMRAPVLAVGDGALGFWKALREVFPQTREQRCRVHKTTNILEALPKSAQPAAKASLAEIWGAKDIDHARTALASFAKQCAKQYAKHYANQYGAKFPKAVAKLTDDEKDLPAFSHYPAEHRIHLRTTNPIESTFATVRLRTEGTRGAGSRAAALAMTFKLIESAQERRRAVNAPHLVALVRAGARFERGVLLEREVAAA